MSAGEVKTCPQCGAPIDARAQSCKFCGGVFASKPAYKPPPQPRTPPPQAGPYAGSYTPPPQGPYGGPYQQQGPYGGPYPPQGPGYRPPVQQQYHSGKSKLVAGLLAIFLGGIGVHKFYLGRIGMGVLYLLFCWTGIPALVGFIEGIIYLCSNDQVFEAKYPRHY